MLMISLGDSQESPGMKFDIKRLMLAQKEDIA